MLFRFRILSVLLIVAFQFLFSRAYSLDQSIPIRIGDQMISPSQTLDIPVATENSISLSADCGHLLTRAKNQQAFPKQDVHYQITDTTTGRTLAEKTFSFDRNLTRPFGMAFSSWGPLLKFQLSHFVSRVNTADLTSLDQPNLELSRNTKDVEFGFTSLPSRFIPLIDVRGRRIDIFDLATGRLSRSVPLSLSTMENLFVSAVVSDNGQYLAVVFTPNIPVGTTRTERLDVALRLPPPRLQLYQVKPRHLLRDTDYGNSRLTPMNLALLSNDGKSLIFEGQHTKRDFAAEQPRSIYSGKSAFHFLNLDTMETSLTKEFTNAPNLKNIKIDRFLAIVSDVRNQIDLFEISTGIKVSSIEALPGYTISSFDFNPDGRKLAVTLTNGHLIPKVFMYDTAGFIRFD